MNNVLTIINILHFFNDGVRTIFVSLLPFIDKDMHLSYTQVGFLGSSQGAMATLLAIPMGIIATKVGGVKLMFLCLLFYSVCAIIIGISPNFIFLSLAFFLAAAAFAPFHLIGQTIVARTSDKSNIGRNLGNFTSIGETGRVVIPAIILFLVVSIGWRSSFFTLAALGLVVFAISIMLFKDKQHVFKQSTAATIKPESIKEWLHQLVFMLRQKRLVLIVLTGIFDNIGGNAIYIFLPFLLLQRGTSPEILSIFMGIFFLGCLVGKTLLGRGVDKYGNIRILIFAELSMMILLLILAVTFTTPILLLVSFILGIFTRGTNPVISSLFSNVSHEAHYEKVYTISEIFLGLAAITSPILFGIIADQYGLTATFYVSAFFAVMATVPIFLYARLDKAK